MSRTPIVERTEWNRRELMCKTINNVAVTIANSDGAFFRNYVIYPEKISHCCEQWQATVSVSVFVVIPHEWLGMPGVQTFGRPRVFCLYFINPHEPEKASLGGGSIALVNIFATHYKTTALLAISGMGACLLTMSTQDTHNVQRKLSKIG